MLLISMKNCKFIQNLPQGLTTYKLNYKSKCFLATKRRLSSNPKFKSSKTINHLQARSRIETDLRTFPRNRLISNKISTNPTKSQFIRLTNRLSSFPLRHPRLLLFIAADSVLFRKMS